MNQNDGSVVPLETHTREIEIYDNEDIEESSKYKTQLYLTSYLILFTICGTLARLGIQQLTYYNEAPIIFNSLWYNLAGCFIMGFLVEDCVIFNYGKYTSIYHREVINIQRQLISVDNNSDNNREILVSNMETIKRSYQAKKKSNPLYIGLTTGFCGCFTSFSSFIRDVFLAIVNLLPNYLYYKGGNKNHGSSDINSFMLPTSYISGFSLMTAIAIILLTTTSSISAWLFGVHIAKSLNQSMPNFQIKLNQRHVYSAITFFALASWLAIIISIIYLYVRHTRDAPNSNGSLLVSLILAPLGCLCRYYTSQLLNNKLTNFPFGTFTSNLVGTIILGISYDLQRIPIGGMIGCQVLKGIQDGFCGCLTTVSSWITELFSLKEKFAYLYFTLSIIICLCLLILINGCMLWTRGFVEPLCV